MIGSQSKGKAGAGDTAASGDENVRRGWLAVLAKASVADLDAAWSRLPQRPRYRNLRPPEAGLVMVRGRVGGSGAPFNLGEMTMTRAVIQLLDEGGDTTFTGFGHVAGRDARHAKFVALFDALLQDPARHDELVADLIGPLARRQAAAHAERTEKVMASRVDFFTMVRGE